MSNSNLSGRKIRIFSKEVWTGLKKGLWLYCSGCETVIIQCMSLAVGHEHRACFSTVEIKVVHTNCVIV